MSAPTPYRRNADNVRFWDDAEIFYSPDANAKVNADGTFGDAWASTGFLNAGADLGQERDTERQEAEGFGGRLLKSRQRFKKDTWAFTAAEDNETIHKLMWPNSPYVVDGTGVLRVPRDAEGVFARKLVDADGAITIDVTRAMASCYPSNLNNADGGHQTREFTVEVRPDEDNALYDRFHKSASDDALEPLEVIRIEAAGAGGGE
ncbi:MULTISPECIES: hypothetical protein [unclassified Dietzia]|uniref:hypothetical protein n=1 Tax=unclassified Dietzia TaxID=2617939 RepID=UPI0015F9CD7E|nr:MULTISPECIES: hypothetical protein [unclassified Dietzia]MBB1022965.1 hypothetical protein [Dietzia sp. DQ12-76]MBB1026471.1 hypothetical protein [Dietzia sp. DQ11-38-2]